MRISGIAMILSVLIQNSGFGQIPGVNHDPFEKAIGNKPYEMVGRKEAREPMLTFDDCTKWQVNVRQGEAALYRTREERVIGDFSGKVACRMDSGKMEFRVELVDPLKLDKEWDCINFWNFGSKWLWEGGPVVRHSLILRDAKGEEQKIPFVQEWLWPDMCYKYWYQDHVKLSDTIRRPVTLIGMEFKGTGKGADSLKIFLGPLYAYKEELNPMTFKPLPDKLPFPLRKETILPVNKTGSFTNSITESGGLYQFRYNGTDADLRYEVDISKPLGGISVIWKGERKLVDSGAEIVFENQVPARWTILSKRLAEDTLFVRYKAIGKGLADMFECFFTIRQKSLVVGIEEKSRTGRVEEIRLGGTGPVKDARLVGVPFLVYNPFSNNSYTPDRPNLLYADGLFYLTMFDWYYTNASMWFGGEKGIHDGYAVYNGGARYIPLINGTRNPVRERLFINVSPDVHEVFPTVDNPGSPMRSNQADRFWAINGGSDLEKLGKFVTSLRSRGVEKVSIRYHEEFWREGGESFTFRLEPNPSLGEEKIREYIRFVQSNDWRAGLYTNYMDFAPVNALWNEDWVRRSYLGGWGPAWSRCYAPKVSIGWEQEALLAPRIHQKFGTNFSYCDVETCISPMDRVDYDYRAPGAGKFRSVFEYIGLTLMNERRAYQGPVYSEGGTHWFYAGLADGNYAYMDRKLPVFPDFQLLKIHPLEMDGMANISGDEYVPFALAFGTIGILSEGTDAIRRYALLQPVQDFYSMVPVEEISYFDGQEMVNSTIAVIKDLIKAPALRIIYRSGLRVYSNLSEVSWSVSENGESYNLPPNGFLAFIPGHNLMSSRVINRGSAGGSKIERVFSDNLYYINTYGDSISGRLAGNGSYMLKKEKFGWEIIPVGDLKKVDFDPGLIGLKGLAVDIQAVDESGIIIRRITDVPMSGRITFNHAPENYKYQVCPVEIEK